jgi:hypothetical protein
MFGSGVIEDRGDRGAKSLVTSIFAPSKLEEFGGEGRCGVCNFIVFLELSSLLF